MRTADRRLRSRDDGFTVMELVVTTSLFAVLMAVFAVAATTMLEDVRRQQARVDDLDQDRKIVQLVDRTLRYANAVNVPVLVNGAHYVEWTTGNRLQQQTCHQWRLTADGQMQNRSWAQPFTPSGSSSPTPAASAPSPWLTHGQRISVPPGAVPPAVGPFVLSPAPTAASPTPTASTPVSSPLTRQQLTLRFVSQRGDPAQSVTTDVTLTALNSQPLDPSQPPGPPSPPVCQEVPRT